MLRIPFIVANTYTDGPFSGGQTAICFPEGRAGEILAAGEHPAQEIARETAAACTCFVFPDGDGWRVRWFGAEAPGELGNMKYTLPGVAEALRARGADRRRSGFTTVSGPFTVLRGEDGPFMAFRAAIPAPAAVTDGFVRALGGTAPEKAYMGKNPILLLKDERAVRALEPDMEAIMRLPEGRGLFVAAPGDDADVVSRAFWPKIGIPEDTVCISMHADLGPLWKAETGRAAILSRQASARGGLVRVRTEGEEVLLSGTTELTCFGELRFESI
ncbi:MAG: PhzF family phenazine biosynthesis protein [Clostridia bacterium]|nr:PhzF family phenazine biosynthesis protein [Clostridia bacterium]